MNNLRRLLPKGRKLAKRLRDLLGNYWVLHISCAQQRLVNNIAVNDAGLLNESVQYRQLNLGDLKCFLSSSQLMLKSCGPLVNVFDHSGHSDFPVGWFRSSHGEARQPFEQGRLALHGGKP